MLIKIVTLIFGLVLEIAGVLNWFKSHKLMQACTAHIGATVIGFDEKITGYPGGGRRGYYKHTKVSYSVNGTEYHHIGSAGYQGIRPKHQEGDAVTVLFDPSEPERCYIAEEKAMMRLGWLSKNIVGVIIILLAIFVAN